MAAQTILVVDDETMMGEMLVRYLTRTGFQAIHALTGADALGALKAQRIDAVLLDITLKDEAGYDVLKQIKAEQPALPVIMLTGLGYDENAMQESLKLGASGYLSKSADVSEVKVALGRVLNP